MDKTPLSQRPLPEFILQNKNYHIFPGNRMTLILNGKAMDSGPMVLSEPIYKFFMPYADVKGMFIGEDELVIQKDMLHPVKPEQPHGVKTTVRGVRFMEIHFSRCFMNSTAMGMYGSRALEIENTPFAYDKEIASKIIRYIGEHKRSEPGRSLMMDCIAEELAIMFLRKARHNFNHAENPRNGKSCLSVKRAINYFNENYDRPYAVEDIKAIIKHSLYHFIRTFKNETGKTPCEYFIEIKIMKAQELLQDRKLSITDICFICGFNNHSHFSRTFKAKTGLSPSEYRSKILLISN